MRLGLHVGVAALAALLGGCAGESDATVPSADAIEQAGTATPADPRIADLYRQSCRACHTVPGSGAPLTGDRRAWDQRWEKGADALRSSTIRGLNGMPAGGQCFACTPQDYDALIRFLAGRNEGTRD
jgi:cytochrome c5